MPPALPTPPSVIRKGTYAAWSGRQAKTLNEQAERYGLPIGGKTVDLALTLKRFHDLLAEFARMSSGESEAMESYRTERALLARYERMQKEAELLPRDLVQEMFASMARVLRAAGERLSRKFGPAAQRILDEAIEDAARSVERQLEGKRAVPRKRNDRPSS